MLIYQCSPHNFLKDAQRVYKEIDTIRIGGKFGGAIMCIDNVKKIYSQQQQYCMG